MESANKGTSMIQGRPVRKLALVISPGANVRMGELMGWLEEEGLQPEVVAYTDPTVDWKSYSLVLPTPALEYASQYEVFMEVRRSSSTPLSPVGGQAGEPRGAPPQPSVGAPVELQEDLLSRAPEER